jgi:hypothetical protein
MKNKTIVCALAFAALFFAVLMPPEAYPNGKLAVLLCATFPFFISITERRIPAKYLLGGLCLFGLLLIHTLWISVDLYSSLDFTTVIWTYYCLIGFFLYAGFEPLEPLALTMLALAVIVSGYSFYQYFWGFDRLYTFIFYAASDQVVKAPALGRIADRRVFSTLALPGTLWGFLAIALPFHAALWRKNWLVNAGLAISAVALLGAGFLTRSFGFVLGLLVLACAWILLHHRRVVWNRLSILFLVLAVTAGSFYSVRRGVIETSNPAGLRLKNWVSAWTIFATHPLGTGGNTFAVMYPRYMLPGANETQYTHNTPLQLLSEFGVPLLVTGIALFLLAVKRWKPRTLDRMTQCCLLALIVWCVHNLVDIDVYFPSLGVIGAVLIGVFFRQLRVLDSASQDLPAGPPRAWMSAPVVALGIMAMLFSGLATVSSELKHRAQAEYEQHKMDTAVQTLEWAKTIMPIDSSLYHDAGDILLDMHTRTRDPKHLVAATESFRQAIALSPMKVGPHIGLGLCLSWTNDLDGALEQVRAAEELFPDSTYVQSIAKLLEGRKGN